LGKKNVFKGKSVVGIKTGKGRGWGGAKKGGKGDPLNPALCRGEWKEALEDGRPVGTKLEGYWG